MLFNSIDFALFLPIVFFLYWFVVNNNLKRQNFLIVLASYFFYGCWDWRFLSLILFSTIVDYAIGLRLSKQENQQKRKLLLWISIAVNLGFLGVFKYYNFFLDNLVASFSFFGVKLGVQSLKIILPVGISFYTFQTLSYTIDVYNRKLSPTKDFVAFAAFVSFFPQLVAGPIERATNLLPQFFKKRVFNYNSAISGLRQILWGLFKKIVIADNCAKYANIIFNHSDDYSGSTIFLGAIFFAFQIYGDFSGYSDIAIGTSRLFGFNLMQNFAFPYFSRDVAEFWRRWHISLSTWFRDYLYIPLGGSRLGKWTNIRNVFIIFIVSGFWHGANWTFIVWGALNALFFLPLLLTNNNRSNIGIVVKGKMFPSIRDFLSILFTFFLIVLAWVFFRANNLEHAISCISEIFSSSLFQFPEFQDARNAKSLYWLLLAFLILEWWGREQLFALDIVTKIKTKALRYTFYYVIIFVIFWFGGEKQNFIYFQF